MIFIGVCALVFCASQLNNSIPNIKPDSNSNENNQVNRNGRIRVNGGTESKKNNDENFNAIINVSLTNIKETEIKEMMVITVQIKEVKAEIKIKTKKTNGENTGFREGSYKNENPNTGGNQGRQSRNQEISMQNKNQRSNGANLNKNIDIREGNNKNSRNKNLNNRENKDKN